MAEKKPVIGLSWQPQLPAIRNSGRYVWESWSHHEFFYLSRSHHSLASREEAKQPTHILPKPRFGGNSGTAKSTGSGSGSSKSSNNNGCVNESQSGVLWSPNTELVDGLFVPPNDPKKLNKLLKKQVKDTAGTSWFDMPAVFLTPELKKDIQLLKLRSAMDPKRHYKKSDAKSKALPKYFQVGTVVESSSDFFSNRLTKKERKATMADELLSDPNLGRYRKRKVQEIEDQNRPGGNDKWKIRGLQSQKRSKRRRH